jgi:hypothetical protein
MNIQLHKHRRYHQHYRPFDRYWGLGVEHETYIQTSKTARFYEYAHKMNPERYSIRYYSAYRQKDLMDAFEQVLRERGVLDVPILLNSHSFTDADIYGEHMTTYERQPAINPKFNGETLHQWACRHSSWLRQEYERSYLWDGDTVECMTQRFYKATVRGVIDELSEIEQAFVRALQSLPSEGILTTYSPLRLATPTNHPWATYVTNPGNIAMFNNGTIHINCTLPTRLDAYCRPLWYDQFRTQHQRLARLIQWIEPFWIAVYGSGDPFASLLPQFAAGSQRVAVSRYIGLGTFDTDTMPRGKINHIPRDVSAIPWYSDLYNKTAYVPIDIVGMDMNYNKHWSHGLELRCFDQMNMESLTTVLTQLVQVMDASLKECVPCPNARKDRCWQSMATDSLYHGRGWYVSPEQMDAVYSAFGITACQTQKEPILVEHALDTLVEDIQVFRGECWEKMVLGTKRTCSWFGC